MHDATLLGQLLPLSGFASLASLEELLNLFYSEALLILSFKLCIFSRGVQRIVGASHEL